MTGSTTTGGGRHASPAAPSAPTPPPVAQLEAIVHLVRSVLGEDAIGGYLHGSGVLGGLRPHSDLDVLVVARRCLTAAARRALGDGLLACSGGYPRRGSAWPVELTVVV